MTIDQINVRILHTRVVVHELFIRKFRGFLSLSFNEEWFLLIALFPWDKLLWRHSILSWCSNGNDNQRMSLISCGVLVCDFFVFSVVMIIPVIHFDNYFCSASSLDTEINLYPGKKNESIKRKWTSRCQVHLFATSHPLSTSTLLQYKGEFNLKERKHKYYIIFFVFFFK